MVRLWLANVLLKRALKQIKKTDGKLCVDIGRHDIKLKARPRDPEENGKYLYNDYYENVELFVKGYVNSVKIDVDSLEEQSDDENLPDTIEGPSDYNPSQVGSDALMARPYFEEWIQLDALDRAFESGREDLKQLIMMGFGGLALLVFFALFMV